MQKIKAYYSDIVEHLESFMMFDDPKNLYEPISYILSLGGKRLRPVLTLLSADLFGKNYKEALDAALAIEVFHNFSLIHDDIMDEAPLRRGQDTVHLKWDLNTGILSGDAMLILAYRFFEKYPPQTYKLLVSLFSKTALEVCEGQQYDIDFETRNDVAIDEYLKMIEYKTAVLVGAAMKMGAIIAGANREDQDLVYSFGVNLGIAFQLQDDYLDAFGSEAAFGKQVGGDIIENKKTYLYLKALELLDESDAANLLNLYNGSELFPEIKVKQVKELFEQSGSKQATKLAIKQYTERAFSVLDQLNISDHKKQQLVEFGNQLMHRNV